jgi:diguanylate cyclase (GGDEF)-like protein
MRWLPRLSRPTFDAAAEQRQIVETVLRSATALVAADDDARQLISRHCETLTQLAPHIVLAWTWFGPPAPDQIRPQVVAGSASAYARDMSIDNNWLTRLGPAHRALAGRRLEPFAVSQRSLYGPWRRAAQDHGVKSVLALPLCSSVDDQRGLFVLYADVPGYFDQVGVGLFDALAGLFSAVLSRAARNAELARVAQRDALTGLANRRALALMDPAVRRLSAHDPPASLVLLDIDHFKDINDRLGHAAGDEAIRRVAQLLLATLREGDTVVRWGGEEFVVWLPGLDILRAQAVAEKLRLAVAEAPPPCMTVSIGMAELRLGESLADAIHRADHAMYAAKQAGRNRVVSSEALPA